ncbi:HNH endonuclease [Kitasatospora azatica]|uniref:HNH endonuclease n=1 Tax=Kitasatospora azatica TaxID=58347 RepID=UPI0009FEBC04|nr:HNH endonuclease [Kitasatospora azatica]
MEPGPPEGKKRRNPDWEWDELVLVCDLVASNGWEGIHAREKDPRVIELSRHLRSLPVHPAEIRREDFRNENSVGHKTYDFATAYHPDRATKKGGAGVLKVLQEFLARPAEMAQAARRLRDGIEAGSLLDLPSVSEEDLEEFSAIEGRLLLRRHFARERNRTLRTKKIDQVRRRQEALACESCGFDFEKQYGERGRGYIECHHVVPLHEAGEERVRLDDLALICANCHRMIHRRAPWLTPSQLKDVIWGQPTARIQVVADFPGHGRASGSA